MVAGGQLAWLGLGLGLGLAQGLEFGLGSWFGFEFGFGPRACGSEHSGDDGEQASEDGEASDEEVVAAHLAPPVAARLEQPRVR